MRMSRVTFANGMKMAMLAGLLALSPLSHAKADEVDDLRNEVQQLKQKVLYLENQMPKGGGTAAGGGTVAAQNEVRFQQYDQQMSQLTGQIEQLELKINDLADKFERMQKDTEFRLGELERGGAGGMSAAAPVADASGAAPAAAPAAQTDPGAPPQPAQPGVMGTLSSDQMQNLPQAPAGAADQAASAAGGSVVLPGDTPQEQYDYATGLVQRGAYAEAELALKAFVSEHPKDPLAGNAQYWLGETYYVRSDFKNASVAFAEGYQKYPKSQKSSDNLLKLGMSLGQIGRNNDACTAFRQLDKQFPDASQAIKDRAARAKQRYKCS